MKLYYYKKKDTEKLEIKVEGSKSKFKMLSGDNQRFKLSYEKNAIFWGTICHYYDGLWYIIGNNHNFFPYIKSHEIEKRRDLLNYDKLYSWGKYYIEQLKKINFFYDSLWHMDFYYNIHENFAFKSYTKELIYDFEKTFDFDKIRYLDWYGEDNHIILNTKTKENIDSGRIKWWRKKIQENNLPPILLWFIPSLDAYIILDGHSRYYASLLEGKMPDLVTISAVNRSVFKENKKQIQNVLKSLNKTKRNMSVKKLNDILIKLYGEREYFSDNFISEGILDFEKKWEVEIKEVLDKNEYLDKVLNRKTM